MLVKIKLNIIPHVCFQRCREAPRRRDLHQWCKLLPQGPGRQRLCRHAQVWTSPKKVGCLSFLFLLLFFFQCQKQTLTAFPPVSDSTVARDRWWQMLNQGGRELISSFSLPLHLYFFFPSFALFLDVFLCVCAQINHLNFSPCVDWCVTTVRWWLLARGEKEITIGTSSLISWRRRGGGVFPDCWCFKVGGVYTVHLCAHSDLSRTGGAKLSAGGM